MLKHNVFKFSSTAAPLCAPPHPPLSGAINYSEGAEVNTPTRCRRRGAHCSNTLLHIPDSGPDLGGFWCSGQHHVTHGTYYNGSSSSQCDPKTFVQYLSQEISTEHARNLLAWRSLLSMLYGPKNCRCEEAFEGCFTPSEQLWWD